jgi:(2R)-3-sulfolactate dehydrogenase (NADP+)
MATTTAAHGKLTIAAERNIEEIPISWGFVDSEGNPTTSRRAAEKGWSAPFGGYKGTALAMMVEILCAGFSGGPMASEAPPGTDISSPLRLSNCFLALDPGRFMGPGECETRMGRLVDMVKSSEPVRKDGEVLVAGEPELRTERKRLAEGIPIPEPLWERLLELAGQLRIAPLGADAG